MNKLFSSLEKEKQLTFILQHELQQNAFSYLTKLALVNKWANTIDFHIRSVGNLSPEKLNLIKETFSPKELQMFIQLRNEFILPFITNKMDLSSYKIMFDTYIKESAIFISFRDDIYPAKLKKIGNAPLSFFKKGRSLNISKSVAIVGRRKAGDKAKKIAFDLGYKLGALGFTVISGLAEGIDAKGHEGCLRAQGNTIAVYGTPINIIYPKINTNLARSILTYGTVISERSFEKSHKHGSAFINRNRIISALSNAVIVVESNEKGGSLHQIKFAIEQKKAVYYYLPEGGEQRIIAKKILSKYSQINAFEDIDELVEILDKSSQQLKNGINKVVDQPSQISLFKFFEK